MNWKFVIYLISVSLFSFFSFFKSAGGFFLVISLGILALINYFYYNSYNSLLGIQRKTISKGLLYSSVIGMILFIPLFLGDFSYRIVAAGGGSTIDLLLPLGIIIYLLSMVICFIVDAFFNNEIKEVKKGRIASGSFLFYLGLYFINVFLSLFLGGIHALTFN